MARKGSVSNVASRINRTTGVTSNVNGARGVFRVNGGRSESGTSTRFGNRAAKRRDLRAAFGLFNG